MVLLALLAGAVIIWIGFTRLLRDAWPWQQGGLETTTPGFQLMQLVLTLIGGIGAAILVVVAYRRQRDLETARFDDRFAAAAAQLGADTAAERLAGVYAMAALADTWEQHRQQCINVLCAYLRLPYDPGAGLLAEVVSEHTWPVGTGTGKETRTYRSLPNDREVRHTIIRVITEHLRDTAATSWQGHDFDFTGAVFDGGDFTGAHFTGGQVSFDGANFSVGQVSFDGAHFAGGQVSFGGARFSGGRVSFDGAHFAGGQVWFSRVTFAGGRVSFGGATFLGGRVSFDWAMFVGGLVSFGGATFSGGEVSFDWAMFFDGLVSFFKTTFAGGQVSFKEATFAGGQVSFKEATFAGSQVSFDGATFARGVTVQMPTHDPAAGGWPTSQGRPFYGWPPAEADDEPSNEPPPAGPEWT